MERILEKEEIRKEWRLTINYVLNESLKGSLDEIEWDFPTGVAPSRRAADRFFVEMGVESPNDYKAIVNALTDAKSEQSRHIENRLLGPKSPYRGIFEQNFLKEVHTNIRTEAAKELDSITTVPSTL